MNPPLRPSINLTDFRRQVPLEELQEIIVAMEKAMAITLEVEGTDLYIPHFRAIYSSCLFPRIWGMMAEAFAGNEAWEVKKSSMTFVLIKKGVCQFHFYKGHSKAGFKAVSKRQKAIVQGELYGDLENLPSIILQHISDRANANLVGFHALFYVRGALAEQFDVMRQTATHHPKINMLPVEQPTPAAADGLAIKFVPKKRSQPAATEKRQKKG